MRMLMLQSKKMMPSCSRSSLSYLYTGYHHVNTACSVLSQLCCI
uniref:Uncharacterized protein n=1 Tax=Arundo donax TaxID=35708 RepID=A0A0A8YNK8_ARUDO